MIKVNLFSGGLDSYIAAKVLKPDVNLYIDVGERWGVRQLDVAASLDVDNFTYVVGPNLREFVDGDFLPNRNMLFLTMAASYGEMIISGSTKGDAYPDKTDDFYNAVVTALNLSIGKPGHYLIHTPFEDMIKSDVVGLYKLAGLPMAALSETTSCYDPEQHECMECGSCLRRLMAFAINGYREDEVKKHVYKIWTKLDSGTWSGCPWENLVVKNYLIEKKLFC